MKDVERSTHSVFRRVRMAARSDWRQASRPHRMLLLVVVGAVIYEWGIGNEIATPWLSALLIEQIGTAVAGALVAAAVIAALTLVQQIIVGWLVLRALTLFPTVSDLAVRMVRGRFDRGVPSWWALPKFQAVAVSFSLGGSFVAVEETLAGGSRIRRTIVISSCICAAMLFMIVGVIGSVSVLLAGTAVGPAVGTIVDVLANPVPWILLAVVPSILRWLHNRQSSPDAPTDPTQRSTALHQTEDRLSPERPDA